MPYAYNTKEKAISRLLEFNQPRTRWTAKLSIGMAVGHSSLNLYADGKFAGTLQGDILGPALYREKNGNGREGAPIPLTWQKVLDGIDTVYTFWRGFGWGVWMCHDVTAAVFRRWGLRGQDVYQAAYASTPGGRAGLVTARIAALIPAVGTTSWLAVHEAWNAFQDQYRAIGYGILQEKRSGAYPFLP